MVAAVDFVTPIYNTTITQAPSCFRGMVRQWQGQRASAMDFLVVQWLRIHAFTPGFEGPIPGWGTISHMLHSAANFFFFKELLQDSHLVGGANGDQAHLIHSE